LKKASRPILRWWRDLLRAMSRSSAKHHGRRASTAASRRRPTWRTKALGVQDTAFHRKNGLSIPEMVRSASVFRRLCDFRSGIEGVISTLKLKRAFRMDRCLWRGLASFRAYV
jgi:hypothetical protein